jgi:hypothetical protein
MKNKDAQKRNLTSITNESSSVKFMIEEYSRISNAFFGLQDQIDRWIKFYISFIGIFIAVITAFDKYISVSQNPAQSAFPKYLFYLILLFPIIGVFITINIVAMRHEMMLYARVINLVRRYFGKLDKDLIPFLVLPTSDYQPPFYEPQKSIFWQVILIGTINTVCFALSLYNLLIIEIHVLVLVSLLFLFCHWWLYYYLSQKQEKKWLVTFSENLNESKY